MADGGNGVRFDPQAGASRYHRQLGLIGTEGQEKLAVSTVLVAGVGGLGGTAALYLAAAGVGRLILVHEGVTVEPDLNRQILMSADGIGRSRVEQAAESIRRLNPGTAIEVWDGRVEPEPVRPLVRRADVVVDARYDFPERYALNRLCQEEGKVMVEAAMYGYEISMTTIVPGVTPCLECLYPESPKIWEPLGFPVLGAVSGMAGCMAALEVIKWLVGQPITGQLVPGEQPKLGLQPVLAGTLLRMNALNYQTVEVDVAGIPRCSFCGGA